MGKHRTTTKILDDNWNEILMLRRAGTSISTIAAKFNISHQALSARLKKNSKPLESIPTHASLELKGISTTYDNEGNIKRQLVREAPPKPSEDNSFQEALEAFLTNPRMTSSKPIPSPSSVDSDTMSIYSIGDAHIGLLSWGRETGEDYNTNKCVADILSAVDLLVAQAHPSKEAFIIDVGRHNCRLV